MVGQGRGNNDSLDIYWKNTNKTSDSKLEQVSNSKVLPKDDEIALIAFVVHSNHWLLVQASVYAPVPNYDPSLSCDRFDQL